MFVYDFVPVDERFDTASDLLVVDSAHWLYRAASAAYVVAAAMAGPKPDRFERAAGGLVSLDLGPIRARDDAVIVPLRWSGPGAPSLFSSLEGDLQLAPLDAERSHLSLFGNYDPPEADLKSRADTLLTQRLAEASVRGFLHRVSTSLGPARSLG
jgi:hypothetical protein